MEELLKDLKEVVKKHKLSLLELDEYDGEDKYSGITQYLLFEGKPDYSKTVQEIFSELFEEL